MTPRVTHFIFWERRGRLAADARPHLDTPTAKLIEVRSEREFRAELPASPFPVVVLDRAATGDRLAEAIVLAATSETWIVVVGPASADERRRDRDLGAHLLYDAPSDHRIWGGTMRRLLRASQERFSSLVPAPRR